MKFTMQCNPNCLEQFEAMLLFSEAIPSQAARSKVALGHFDP